MPPDTQRLIEDIEDGVTEVLNGHGLHLEQTTWRRDFAKHTVNVAFKIVGDLDNDQELPLAVRG